MILNNKINNKDNLLIIINYYDVTTSYLLVLWFIWGRLVLKPLFFVLWPKVSRGVLGYQVRGVLLAYGEIIQLYIISVATMTLAK